MTKAFETTFNALAATKNEAAVDLLITALDSPMRNIQEGGMRGLLSRRNVAGHRELLHRWDSFPDRWKTIIANHGTRMNSVIREAILGENDQFCSNACDAILQCREYDMVAPLIRLVEDKNSLHSNLACETLTALVEMLYEELSEPRDYRNRRDPQLVRKHVVASLEQSVNRFQEHKRKEIVEAFLMLARHDNATLRQLLQNPYSKNYLVVIDVLVHSPRMGVLRLLLNSLEEINPITAMLHTLGRRQDTQFLRRLFKKMTDGIQTKAGKNLKRVEKITWAENLGFLDAYNDAEQHGAVNFAVSTSIPRVQVLQILQHILSCGNTGGRQAASKALEDFNGAEVNTMVMESLHDPDPQVQANLIVQLRHRGIPGAISALLVAVDSPHDIVRQAAQQSLTEFSFSRYLSAFDMLEDDIRVSTGKMVLKIDPETIPGLTAEMGSPARSRRLRALEIIPVLDAASKLERPLIALLFDKDHFVRACAAGALSRCDTPTVRRALRQALLDPSVAVQEAAEESLRTLSESDLQDNTTSSETAAANSETETPSNGKQGLATELPPELENSEIDAGKPKQPLQAPLEDSPNNEHPRETV